MIILKKNNTMSCKICYVKIPSDSTILQTYGKGRES